MPYTRSWSDATPAGTRAANQIDDAIREFKVDLHERMNSAFAVDWTTDPVVALPEVKGNVVGKTLYVPGYAFQVDTGFTNTRYASTGFTLTVVDPAVFAPLFLPVGVTITKLRWRIVNGDANTVQMFLYSMPFTTGTSRTQENLINGNTAADTIYDSGVIAIVVGAGVMYNLAVDKSAGITAPIIHGVEITYTTPDCRNTY